MMKYRLYELLLTNAWRTLKQHSQRYQQSWSTFSNATAHFDVWEITNAARLVEKIAIGEKTHPTTLKPGVNNYGNMLQLSNLWRNSCLMTQVQTNIKPNKNMFAARPLQQNNFHLGYLKCLHTGNHIGGWFIVCLWWIGYRCTIK